MVTSRCRPLYTGEGILASELLEEMYCVLAAGLSDVGHSKLSSGTLINPNTFH